MLKYLRQSSGMDFIDSLRHKRVFKFDDFRDTEHISMIFGKKGTNLCLISKIGIPVPPGFIISSESYFDYLKDGAKIYDKLEAAYSEIILDWEAETGRKFNPLQQDLEEMNKFPILLSVRPSCGVADLSCVPSSVLNIGLNDEIVEYIIQITGNKLFAYDIYRRFIQQFGIVVLGIRQSSYVHIEQQIMHEEDVSSISSLSDDAMERLVTKFKEITDVPPDGAQQLLMTIDAMYEWWIRHHPEEKSLTFGMSGISIIVQEMVHGNINHSSGSGIAYCTPFTRGIYSQESDGQELKDDQEKNPSEIEALSQLQHTNPYLYEQVVEYAQAIKREIGGNNEDSKISIDFTIQNGIVFVLEVKDQSKIAQLLSFVGAVKNDSDIS